MAKMNKKMITLCTAAVGAIYISGYTLTQPLQAERKQPDTAISAKLPASDSQQSPDSRSMPESKHYRGHEFAFSDNNQDQNQDQNFQSSFDDRSSNQDNSSSFSQDQNSSSSSSSKNNQASGSSSEAKQTYKDGTYTGQGSNHIGSVEVAVTIKKGKIENVEITNCDTHYSESYIENFPAEVVKNQSSKVNAVSGATLSAEDFEAAVDEALVQAQQA
ncbi:FMN-binding protein [Metabacillus sp. RGM 3146]|uniref:FMN-binding protein n=1 Tax=Metabacillus sp. RGM 3146 TaxID=3401092 RepID=UPI003B9AB10D